MANITRARRLYTELENRFATAMFGTGIKPNVVKMERSTIQQNRVLFNVLIGNRVAAANKTTDQINELIEGINIGKAGFLLSGKGNFKQNDLFGQPPIFDNEAEDEQDENEEDEFEAAAPAEQPQAQASAPATRRSSAKKGSTKTGTKSSGKARQTASKSTKTTQRSPAYNLRRRHNAPAEQPEAQAPVTQEAPQQMAASQRTSGRVRQPQAPVRRRQESFVPTGPVENDDSGVPAFAKRTFNR